MVIIKKYANRKLYNTHTFRYINLSSIIEMVRDGIDFRVLSTTSGADITHDVLIDALFKQVSSSNDRNRTFLNAGVIKSLIRGA